MARFTRDGVVAPEYWIGKERTCGACKCEFEITRDSAVVVRGHMATSGRKVVVQCPQCKEEVFLRRLDIKF